MQTPILTLEHFIESEGITLKYSVSNATGKPIQLLDRAWCRDEGGQPTLMPATAIVQPNMDHMAVDVIRGFYTHPAANISNETFPGLSTVREGESLQGEVFIPLPIKYWHPDLGSSQPAQTPMRGTFKLGFFAFVANSEDMALPNGQTIQVPSSLDVRTNQQWLISPPFDLN